MKKFKPIVMATVCTMAFSLVGCANKGAVVDTQSELSTSAEVEGSTQEAVIVYTYTDMDVSMWVTEALLVRDEPCEEGTRIGQLATATEVKVTGQCDQTEWYRIDYNGMVGYIENKSALSEAPVEGETTEGNLMIDLSWDVLNKTISSAGSLEVIGNSAFESYSFSEDRAETYGELVTKVADGLEGISNVYCMPIPLGSGVVLPDEYKDQVSAGNQGAAIDSVLGYMGSNVIGVDIYDDLFAHRDEYLYFRTDHHWTQLGAYYAYTDFCETKGIEPHSLDEYEQVAYEGFVGSFYFNFNDSYMSTVQILRDNPDIVYTYRPISNTNMTVTTSDGSTYKWDVVYDVSNYTTGSKYSCFIAGDNPYTVIENSDISDDTSCIVVKESYGNAFVPYLVDHYQTVYVIDQRYWDGNIINLAKEKNVTDVIFANNLTAIGSKSQLAYFRGIIE